MSAAMVAVLAKAAEVPMIRVASSCFMRISSPCFPGFAVLMLRSVESKYDGFMTWLSSIYDLRNRVKSPL